MRDSKVFFKTVTYRPTQPVKKSTQIDNHKKTLLDLQKLTCRSYSQLGFNLKYIYPITSCLPFLFPPVLSEFGGAGGGGGVFRAMPERKKAFFFQEMFPNKVKNTFRN